MSDYAAYSFRTGPMAIRCGNCRARYSATLSDCPNCTSTTHKGNVRLGDAGRCMPPAAGEDDDSAPSPWRRAIAERDSA